MTPPEGAAAVIFQLDTARFFVSYSVVLRCESLIAIPPKVELVTNGFLTIKGNCFNFIALLLMQSSEGVAV